MFFGFHCNCSIWWGLQTLLRLLDQQTLATTFSQVKPVTFILWARQHGKQFHWIDDYVGWCTRLCCMACSPLVTDLKSPAHATCAASRRAREAPRKKLASMSWKWTADGPRMPKLVKMGKKFPSIFPKSVTCRSNLTCNRPSGQTPLSGGAMETLQTPQKILYLLTQYALSEVFIMRGESVSYESCYLVIRQPLLSALTPSNVENISLCNSDVIRCYTIKCA